MFVRRLQNVFSTPKEGVSINKEMLSRHLTGLQGPIYHVAGPPVMVMEMRKMLLQTGVDEDHIRAEEFGGY